MTDLEISKALALAIGWKEADLRWHLILGELQANRKAPLDTDTSIPHWVPFDYRDWNVIGPIAAKYKRFPQWNPMSNYWFAWVDKAMPGEDTVYADTPQKAIALAVIGAKK